LIRCDLQWSPLGMETGRVVGAVLAEIGWCAILRPACGSPDNRFLINFLG
jgi:hypothetical protein